MLMTVVITVCVVAFSSVVFAQGQSDNAFERVREVQERNTERMLAKPGVVGTAVGMDEDGRHVVLILLEKDNVPDIPADLEGIPVRRIVTGTINALPRGGSSKPPAPSKVPAAPSNLVATAAGTTQINLTWKDNATNETGFKIERAAGTGSNLSYSQIATVGANITSYSSTGLGAGATYTYRIRAYNKFGDSAYSDPASATTGASPTNPPAAPSVLMATAVSSTQINLAWTDNADNEAGFKIERALDGVSFTQIATTGADVTTYSNSGLTASTTYTYRVRAYNAAGNSGYSNTDSATTDAAATPTDPSDRFPRPVPTGVSTGHPSITAGTLSCRVKSGGTLYALSNNHVYAASNQASIGNAVIQPGTYDGGHSPADDIGTLANFKPIVWYPRGSNTIDAAIAATDESKVGKATPAGGYGTPNSTPVTAQLGQAVQKYGRTTGLTHGVVEGVNASILVDYGSGKIALFTGQIMITPGTFSAGGDSGSLIVTDDADCNPVGLLFAGSASATYANPIGDVLGYFGVSIDGR
jgi:hypothetical protein